METQIKINYSECEHLIKEADVLLFRAPDSILSVGWWIAKYGWTPYSHAGLASWEKNQLNCVEFREFIGSRNKPLVSQFVKEGLEIDVFRVHKKMIVPHLKQVKIGFSQRIEYVVDEKDLTFYPTVAQKITTEAKKLVGKKYGWSLIYKIAGTLAPGFRFFYTKYKEHENNLFVCSTLVTHTYRCHYIDLCPFISDQYTTPSDLARSAHLNYLFTIIK